MIDWSPSSRLLIARLTPSCTSAGEIEQRLRAQGEKIFAQQSSLQQQAEEVAHLRGMLDGKSQECGQLQAALDAQGSNQAEIESEIRDQIGEYRMIKERMVAKVSGWGQGAGRACALARVEETLFYQCHCNPVHTRFLSRTRTCVPTLLLAASEIS